jgi:large subunit ribosomal protein L15
MKVDQTFIDFALARRSIGGGRRRQRESSPNDRRSAVARRTGPARSRRTSAPPRLERAPGRVPGGWGAQRKDGEAMKLNDVRDNPGARHYEKRRGRGIGSGLGKTSGKGHKGQRARAGVALHAFEGGQMPLHRRLPKRGFNNIFAKTFAEVNLDKLQQAVDAGKLDSAQPVDAEAIRNAGIVKRTHDGVKILGRGDLTAKLDLRVAGATKSAQAAVEKAGGSVTLVDAEKAAKAQANRTKRGKAQRS